MRTSGAASTMALGATGRAEVTCLTLKREVRLELDLFGLAADREGLSASNSRSRRCHPHLYHGFWQGSVLSAHPEKVMQPSWFRLCPEAMTG